MTQGLCRVITTLPPTTATGALNALAQPTLQRMAAMAMAGHGPDGGSMAMAKEFEVLTVMIRTTRATMSEVRTYVGRRRAAQGSSIHTSKAYQHLA